jgi:hypothetical protein
MLPVVWGRVVNPSRSFYRSDAFRVVRGASGSCGTAAERYVLVFQCYLDDSATTDLPVITLAGFLAKLENWEALEPKIDSIMNGAGVPVFHAKQFHDTKRPFKNWSGIRKRSFAEEIFTATHGQIHGFSVTIRKKDFLEARRQNPQSFGRMSPLCVCFSSIAMKIVTDPELESVLKEHGLAFLLERGNPHNSGIDRFFHDNMVKHVAFEGIFRGISLVPKDHCRAIQLADFFAFYSRRQMRNHIRLGGKLALPACPYLEIMKKHGPIWQEGGVAPVRRVGSSNQPNLAAVRTLMGRSS